MRTCFVPLCDVKNKNQPSRTMFFAPKEKSQLMQWLKVLPNIRTLRSNDRVCHIHFNPEDIVYTFDHIINGKIYKLKRDRPKLKRNAIPYREMPTKDELACYKVKTRLLSNSKVSKALEESIVEQKTFKLDSQECEINELEIFNHIEEDQQTESNTETMETNFSDSVQTTNIKNSVEILLEENQIVEDNPRYSTTINTQDLFNLIYDNVHTILIPNTLWGIHRCPNRSIIYFTYMDMKEMQHTKMITIEKDGLVKTYALSCLIKQLQLSNDICNMDNVSCLLNQVDMWRFCIGKDSSQDCEIIVEPNTGNCWCTEENEQVFFCTICLLKCKRN